jgi:flagellar biosynthetic protein FlhB
MAEHSAQERTEEPTARKLRKAREDGQVARSVELPAAAIVIGTFLLLLLSGAWLIERLTAVFAAGFVFDLKSLAQPLMLPTIFGEQLQQAFVVILPLMGLTIVLAVLASSMTGGFLFSLKAVAPKSSKINPLEGIKRIFGVRALVELAKAILKFVLVSFVLWWTIANEFEALLRLGQMGLEPALAASGVLIAQSALWVALSLALIACIDVPWQKYQFMKRMRMTRQEIKDEFKEVEGRPEVKAQIQRRQREMAQGRMIRRVRDADVIVTNPEHFAVALEYDPSSDRPPIVIAKGVDHMAQRIRE